MLIQLYGPYNVHKPEELSHIYVLRILAHLDKFFFTIIISKIYKEYGFIYCHYNYIDL